KQINDGIAGFEQDAKQRATNTAKQMRTATSSQVQQSIASLTQIEESKVTQLHTFADTQKQALEHTTGTGIAALANGVTQTVGSLVGSMDEFVATAAATPPPDAEELEPTLAAVEGQTVAATDEMQSQITVAAQASDDGMGTALSKATAALSAQSVQGNEQTAAAAQTFTAGTGALRAQASKGFAKFEEGDKKTANDMGKGAEDGFQQAAKGARESFGNLATAVSDNFQKGYTQLFDALWGKENQAKLVADMRKYGDEAAAKVQPRWKKVLKWVVTIVVIIAVIAVTVLTAGALGPVGVVLLGATLGALAGAVTTIAHNLIDGKKWSDGVAKAMIVGAIGGAFGGAGGVIFKNVGSVALKIGLEAGLDVAGGIVGEVTGSLAVGEAIDWTNVVTGALIGAGIGAGLGIGGALKGKFKFKAKVDVPTPNVRPHIEPPAPPAGRFRGAMEKVGILAPRGPTIRPHTGLPEGTGGRPAAETPGVHPKSDARPTKTSIPEGTPPTRPRNPHGNHPEIEDGIVAKQPALAGEHQIKVLRDGRVVRCSNCGELRLQYKSEINANPKLKKRLDDIEALADPKLKAQRAAELELDLTAAKARLDAKKLIGPSRKFSDAELENAYQAYRVRKANIGETPRGRADWKVTRDYWMIDSPMARGNNFNKTAGKKYRYNEVNLETGKRVDSYDPVKGEIISRKATDFDIIDESAFKGYLRELKNKYSPGEVIRSNKYPKLDGKPLTGKQILEVPSTNATAANRANFEALAASEGIQIRYTPE
ncbi:MAG: hypothetical protein OEW08_11805, partial [Gammaproteobacteria bacterium]|nr:hypothetical protein [Gammaproteobacteria bacterium]